VFVSELSEPQAAKVSAAAAAPATRISRVWGKRVSTVCLCFLVRA
jgi:hypothetical protein